MQQASTTASTQKSAKDPPSLSTLPVTNPWIHCICILKFDLELGQVLEHVYPPQSMHQKEEKDLTSLAFPESNSLACEGNLQYTFRLRHFSKLPLTAISPSEHNFSFGFTMFNQRKDPKSTRGFTQRSIVIVSDLYFVQFYYQLVEIAASKCQFGQGSEEDESPFIVLKKFYDALNHWPVPIPGEQLELNVFGYILQVDLPIDMLENLNLQQRQRRMEFYESKGIHIKSLEKDEEEQQQVQEGSNIMTNDSHSEEKKNSVELEKYHSQEQKISNQSNSNQQEDEEEEKKVEELKTENSNNQYIIEPEHDLNQESDRKSNRSTVSQKHILKNNQQDSELITYLTKQYSCSEMFGELIIQKYFQGQSLLILWHLWEIAITETPLLVVGDDPTECSHAVLILLSLISPLKTLADYRPYITIYDQDVKEFAIQCKKKQMGNAILGVSNPYLITYIGQLPAVLHFERGHFIEKKLQSPKDLELTSKCVKHFSKIPKEVKHSLVSQQKMYMKPSKVALKHLNLDKSVEESLAINNWILRKHFKEMTETFLASFNSCLRVNYAVRGTGDPLQLKFNITKPFKEKEFLDSIGKDNAFCKNYMGGYRDKTVKLYKKFINTTLFRKYLNDKKKEISAKELNLFMSYHQNSNSQQQQ